MTEPDPAVPFGAPTPAPVSAASPTPDPEREALPRPRFATVELALGLAVLALFFWAGLTLYRGWQGRERRALLIRVERSTRPLDAPELARAGRRFTGDRQLLGAAVLLGRNEKASDMARLNALLLEAAISAPGAKAGGAGGVGAPASTPTLPTLPIPVTIGELEWPGGQVSGARFVDLTFARGHVNAVTFVDSTFAGVTWGAAFAGGRPGLLLSGVRFERSRFEASSFAGTHLTRVDFVDSTLSGADLDVSNFNLVRFDRSPQAKAAPAILRSDIVNRDQAPPAGVDDLAAPTDQVRFTGIAFDGVHFRGWIRPEWFSGCTFTRCVFPAALPRQALAAGHNTVTGCLWGDEPLD
jgi:uncharacterized protein YjbI with pentapeptide repeats